MFNYVGFSLSLIGVFFLMWIASSIVSGSLTLWVSGKKREHPPDANAMILNIVNGSDFETVAWKEELICINCTKLE